MDAGEQTWQVRVFDDLREEDLAMVAEFFNENFPGVFYPHCSPEIWKWKLGASNPAGRGFLTVAFSGGKVVGTTSGTRKSFDLGDDLVSGMEIGDTFTHPDFRKSGYCGENYPGIAGKTQYLNRSIFGRLVTETLDRAAKAGVEYVYGTPNLNSRPPYLAKLGFTEIGYEKVRSWSLLTASRTFSLKYRFPAFLFVNLLKFVTKIGHISNRRTLQVEEGTFERFSLALDRSKNEDYLGVKAVDAFYFCQNLEFYEHRYLRHPTYRYRYFEIRTKKDLVGWIICTQIKRQSGRETLVISDWIGLTENFERNLPNYISMTVPHFENLDSVTVWTAKTSASGFHWLRFGFLGTKDVSIIEKCMVTENARQVREFADFRIGWSDNG